MANPANHLSELISLAKKIDMTRAMIFRRITSRTEHGVPWIVWVALSNDGSELGRSDEFRFTCQPCMEEVPADQVARLAA